MGSRLLLFVFFAVITMSAAFGQMTDEQLMTEVQRTTFKYFWDFAHPTSGLSREGYLHGTNLCTSGGTGMGIMTIVVGAERGFVTRSAAVAQILKMFRFLEDNVVRYHGVWPHWFNGATGETIPFSTYDNGGDLVETAFLIQGILTARRYFDGQDAVETEIRTRATRMWESVEWDWHLRRSDPGYENSEVLYWHWSPDYGWQINFALKGYYEALIVYVLAIASPTHPIPASCYYNGWTSKSSYANGQKFYGQRQWVGPNYGGPLFFTHYSFLGLDPRNKRDDYCDYFENNRNTSLINQAYCIANPSGYTGYSASCWGLSASTNPWGYSAQSPANDNGTITPTAAISSIPYTPAESLSAMRHFYYNFGSNLWGTYGFRDAFNLSQNWYSGTWLAIDQGTIVPMIENYRTGLCWELFMSNAEIVPALQSIGWALRADAGLEYKYYEGSWSQIPNFSAMTPIDAGIASTPTAKIRNQQDNYGLRFEGYIYIDHAGTYTFYTNSDDGSNLYIDGVKVVDNDGLHSTRERSGSRTLGIGLYSIVVDYIEATGGQLLEVSYQGPGIAKRKIPVNVLYRCNMEGDLTNDCAVNMDDLFKLAEGWLNPYNLSDFGCIGANWLKSE